MTIGTEEGPGRADKGGVVLVKHFKHSSSSLEDEKEEGSVSVLLARARVGLVQTGSFDGSKVLIRSQ